MLIAVLATTALFSVFAGPTKALVERAPVLDYLLLIFPTFGHHLGFALARPTSSSWRSSAL